MKITFLGKDPESQDDECPSLYDTDAGTYLVQGWQTSNPAVVEVPCRLMTRMANSGQLDSPSDGQPVEIVRTSQDTYLIRGRQVTDPEARLSLQPVAEFETVIEVALGLRDKVREEYADAAGA
ncbi:hypothetical protein [Streptosporangium jomthongense]|uniref:Uncharacterized protein n=1 Tax=Streptosporangium jomthongense TaxID=1193683 RepID=A0ABV8EY81_9ACTN